MKTRSLVVFAAAVTLAAGSIGMSAHAADQPHTAPATAVQTHTVVAGFGDQGAASNVYAPKVIDVFAGDTVAWRVGGVLEPHTITFGPSALLQQLSRQTIVPVPQREGTPRLALNPQITAPTQVTTYAGTGFVNSGFLRKGQIWRLTFSTPGTYHFYCLLHYPDMAGTVVVHARPQTSATLFHVLAGDSGEGNHRDASAQSDSFFPRRLSIRVGDTVSWTGGFHTITFGPESLRDSLEKHLFIPRAGADGRVALYLNPQAAFATPGTTYNGTGFANSGLLVLRAGKNAPPEYHLTFTKPGVYEYDCLIHPGMDGTITVLPAAH